MCILNFSYFKGHQKETLHNKKYIIQTISLPVFVIRILMLYCF